MYNIPNARADRNRNASYVYSTVPPIGMLYTVRRPRDAMEALARRECVYMYVAAASSDSDSHLLLDLDQPLGDGARGNECSQRRDKSCRIAELFIVVGWWVGLIVIVID